MVSLKDIFLELLLSITCFILASALLFVPETRYFFFIPILVYFVLHIRLKRRKKVAPYLDKEFKKLGYTIVSERAPKWSEASIEVKVGGVQINNIPLSRYGYVRQFARMFEVIEIQSGERLELNTLVTHLWSGKNTLVIKKKKKLTTNQ